LLNLAIIIMMGFYKGEDSAESVKHLGV
jgi:hypothetical protein